MWFQQLRLAPLKLESVSKESRRGVIDNLALLIVFGYFGAEGEDLDALSCWPSVLALHTGCSPVSIQRQHRHRPR